ncbi:MAG: MlaD family protein, partial [Actinomycetota bacterium]|nr:MlaD family protein [Actinomycetota bacterium]
MTLRSRLGVHAARVVVVATLAIAFFVLLLVISRSSGGGFELKAEFDDARGLIPGGEVRAGAINVGKVTAVEFNDDDVPEVTMEVADDFPMHEGATADIRLGSNVGAVNRTIELTQGDTSEPELPEGTVLPAEETDQPVNFDEAVDILNPPTRANIKHLLGGLDAALKGRGKDFDRTLRHSSDALNETANLLAQVNRDGEALRTLVGEGERVVSALASSPQDLGEAAERTALLLETTGNRQAELAESVRLLGPALARGRSVLDELAAATPNLITLVRGLDPAVDE